MRFCWGEDFYVPLEHGLHLQIFRLKFLEVVLLCTKLKCKHLKFDFCLTGMNGIIYRYLLVALFQCQLEPWLVRLSSFKEPAAHRYEQIGASSKYC